MNQNNIQQQQPSQPPLSTSTFSPSSTTSSPHSPTSNNSTNNSTDNSTNNTSNNSNNNSNNNEEPTILQLLISTASSLKRAFPQYKHVTIGDLVFGLVMVAHQHDSHRFYEQELENPKCLKIPPTTMITPMTTAKNSLHMWKPHKYINPEHVPMTLIEKSHLLCHYSDLVYYPICHWEEEAQQQQFQSEAEHQLENGENLENAENAENAGNEKLQVEKSENSEHACGNRNSSNRMEWTHDPNSSETTTEGLNSILMPHAYLDNGMRPTSYMRHLLYYRSESKHCQQVYMCKLDLNLKSLIVSIRGTKNVFDIFTDLSCEASELEAHEFYLTTRQQGEKNRNLSASLQCETLCETSHADNGDNEKYDQMIKGTVHGGFVKSATSMFNQMKPLIDALFLNRNKPLLGTDDDTQMMKSSKHTIVHPRLHQEIETYRNEIQSIDLCGHSMGGGVGTILAILLREYFIKQREKCRQSDHSDESTVFCPDIQVTTFGSSALVDAKLSQWSQSFVNSFILGGDIVPRLSLGQSEILRQEVNATNWRDRLQMILSEHERVGYVANKADQWLTSWGLPGIFNTPTSGTNSATSPMSKDANDEDSVLAGPMLTDAAEALTTLEQMPPLVTLFPPGNCYLLVPLRHNATRIDFKQVLFDAIDTRFGGGNSEDMTESDSTEENSSKKSVLERLKTESTPKKKRSYKSWISNSLGNVLRSTASSLIEDTPASHRDSTEQSKYPVRVITRCSPGANKEGFVLRRVDAQHFDKIILSQYMFDDHRLDHMFDAFSCVLSMERRMIEQNQVCLDDNNIDEAQELYVSAKIPSFPQQ